MRERKNTYWADLENETIVKPVKNEGKDRPVIKCSVGSRTNDTWLNMSNET